jgi:hypothetical protein
MFFARVCLSLATVEAVDVAEAWLAVVLLQHITTWASCQVAKA